MNGNDGTVAKRLSRPSPPRPRPRRWALAVPGLVLVGALVAGTSAAYATERPEGSPLEPPGSWQVVLITAIVVGFAAYVAGVVLAGRFEWSHRRVAVVIAVAVQLLPLAGPLLLSTDAYSYWAYGRVSAVHDENPYLTTPDRFPDDPAVERMGADWRDDAMIYGPVFAIVADAGARVSGTSPERAALFHRVLAAASMLLIVALVARAAPQSVLGVVLVGWNPLLALHAAGGGHNDFPMMALAALGYVWITSGRRFAGGAAWALAVGIKWSAGLLLPLLFLQKRLWRSAAFMAGFAATVAAVALLATALYGTHWLGALQRLSAQGRRTDGSLGLAPVLSDLGLPHRGVLVALALIFLVGYVWLALESLRERPRVARGGELAAITQGWLNPWYAALYMPFVGLERDRVAQVVAVLLTAYFLVDVLPI